MDVARVVDVAPVAAGHRDGDGNGAREKRLQDPRVPVREALLGEPQASEPVALEGIGAREVDRELRTRALQRLVEPALEMPQVFVVARAVGKFDVEVARLLGEGKVARAVDREGERT